MRAPGTRRVQRAHGLHTVQVGHDQVEQHHVGPRPLRQIRGRRPVGRLPDDVRVVLLVQQEADALSNHRVIVHKESADHGGPARMTTRGRCRRRETAVRSAQATAGRSI